MGRYDDPAGEYRHMMRQQAAVDRMRDSWPLPRRRPAAAVRATPAAFRAVAARQAGVHVAALRLAAVEAWVERDDLPMIGRLYAWEVMCLPTIQAALLAAGGPA